MDDFKYKKSLGQNFLYDENIVSKIAMMSGIDKDTLVIEIGPGSGSLSKKIIPLCGYAILYEIDERLRDTLNNELSLYQNYEIFFGDFLEQNISNIKNKYNYKKIYVVANLPYYITTPIITKLMNELYPDRIVVMVQEEVADRLASQYGHKEYGMISVLIGSRYDIKKLFKVSRKCFRPSPNVDSAVISLDKCDHIGNINFDTFSKLIQDAFKFKRKNIKNNLSNYDLSKIEEILKNKGYNLQNRAEEIDIETFIEIAKII